MSEAQAKPVLGIIAGAGRLPVTLAQACQQAGREFFIIAFEEAADLPALDKFPHARVRLGAVGEALAHLRRVGARELVMAGGVRRPSMSSLKPDAAGAKLMARLGLKLFAGDDALLKALIGFLEDEGFRVVGADDVLGDLVAPEGVLGTLKPDAQARADIALGLKVARALGELDVGQAVVVENGYVLGVEAAEGTDALLARCAGLLREEGKAVLVKARKPTQEERADLPTIGPQTIARMAESAYAGVAFEAGGTLLLDRAEVLRLAEENGLFVVGVG